MRPTETTSPLLQLKKMVQSDDDIELLPGLSGQQLQDFIESMPTKMLPPEVKDLLKYAKGFYHRKAQQEVEFSGSSGFGAGNNELWNFAVSIADDGAGNFWLVAVNEQGLWEEVYCASHDPAELILHACNLTEFLQQLEACFESGLSIGEYREQFLNSSSLENSSFDVFFTKKQALNNSDSVLKQFASQLPDNFQIVDLRNKANGSGFSFENIVYSSIQKHPSQPIWGIEKIENKSLLRKLLSLIFPNKKAN